MFQKSLYRDYEVVQKLLPNESWDFRSRSAIYNSPSSSQYRNSQEIAKELLRGAGRFQSPLGMVDRAKLWLQSKIIIQDFFQLSNFFFFPYAKDFFPYPWQVLFRYLKKEGLIKEARINRCYFLHDHPRMLSLVLSSTGNNLNGRGNASDLETALSKSTGELLERTFLSRGYRKYKRKASIAELEREGARFLYPMTLAQIGKDDKDVTSMAKDASMRWHWVVGKSLVSGNQVLIPAQAVFMGGAFSGEPLLREGNSNGAAGGFTFKEAALAALYELIERDSFLVFWLNSIAPPIIDVSDSPDQQLQELLRSIERYRLEAVFLNTTTDTAIPSCICVLIDRSQSRPRFSLGGGAGFDIDRMLLGSLREAIMVYGGGDFLTDQPQLAEGDYVPFTDSKFGLTERITLWKNPEMFPKFEFFIRGEKQSLAEAFGFIFQPMGFREQYAATLKQLNALGADYEAYVYEAQSPVLDILGYHVVKVVVPALISLNLFESNAPLGAKRLRAAPVAMGYQPAEKPNPWPHPFP